MLGQKKELIEFPWGAKDEDEDSDVEKDNSILLEENSLEKEIIHRICAVYETETLIDDNISLYLITWSPDPKEFPSVDFYMQHNMHIDLLVDYIKSCSLAMFCVESTQLGNPHYHGWYQLSHDSKQEMCRICCIKTMQHFGNVKITEARHYKINSNSEKRNALYYYKKDLVDSMLCVSPNPILKDTYTTIDFKKFELASFFTTGTHKGTFKTLNDRISDRQYYREFYADTISKIS